MKPDTIDKVQLNLPKLWLVAWFYGLVALYTGATLSSFIAIALFAFGFWFDNKYPQQDPPITEESIA